ncbi:hypothetical protein FB45DRAFT_1054122, partial [Roridomyces roridus]
MFRLPQLAKTGRAFSGVRNHMNGPSDLWNPKPGDWNYYSTDHALHFRDPFPPVMANSIDRYKPIYAKWHKLRHIPLPNTWSSDWRYWDHGPEVNRLQRWFQLEYGIKGPIQPMAFLADQPESVFAFETRGGYYIWDGAASVLEKYVARFESHEDFLKRLDKEKMVRVVSLNEDRYKAQMCVEVPL